MSKLSFSLQEALCYCNHLQPHHGALLENSPFKAKETKNKNLCYNSPLKCFLIKSEGFMNI